ncbi:GAF and ANTAR domain-containing protein [Kribbella sp. NPDC051936]|uniref:GAF and ANTAR domain-containing protein n=1 Tax=Kribbella sp. NPDC051936 TaxID=3154946 RepID=UPI003442E651
MARLAVELHDAEGVKETADAAVDFARTAIDCEQAGIVLAHGGRVEIGTVTDALVTRLYQLQIEAGTGPMLAALTENTVVHVPDVAEERRWPAWGSAAEAAGIGSVLHVPMRDRERTIGVLSLFSTRSHAFSDDDEAIAVLLGRHVALAVSEAQHDVDLHIALDARATVGQAMGILMERFDVDEAHAFAILRRYSQDNNTRLRDVAEQLIHTRGFRPGQTPGTHRPSR